MLIRHEKKNLRAFMFYFKGLQIVFQLYEHCHLSAFALLYSRKKFSQYLVANLNL